MVHWIFTTTTQNIHYSNISVPNICKTTYQHIRLISYFCTYHHHTSIHCDYFHFTVYKDKGFFTWLYLQTQVHLRREPIEILKSCKLLYHQNDMEQCHACDVIQYSFLTLKNMKFCKFVRRSTQPLTNRSYIRLFFKSAIENWSLLKMLTNS